MFGTWRTASSRSFDWYAARRHRGSELLARAAPADELGCCCDAAWPSGRARDSSHHSWLALEPSMALGSFSLSLLIQVHEAAAVVASGGDAGVEWRPAADSTHAAEGR